MNKTKVYIVDDHQIIIDGLSTYFIENQEFELAGSANSFHRLLDDLRLFQIDILILDINLPELNGIQIAKIVKQDYKDIKVVFLSANTDEDTLNKCANSGGQGYFSKDIDENEFFIGLKKIKRNEVYYSKGIHKVLFGAFADNAKLAETNNIEILSQREIEVIKLFADGLSFKEIADKLFISARTVESHKNHIMKKLDLKNTVELIKYAILNGISSL